MTVFTWNATFATDHVLIDRQHRQLIDLINELGDALATGRLIDDRALSRIFDRLRWYATSHFADEEQLMVDAGLDSRHQESHRRVHEEFTDQLGALWDARDRMTRPAETILGFLSAWLAQHILGVDMVMVRQIQLTQAGESAERAYELASASDNPSAGVMFDAMRDLLNTLSNFNLDLDRANRSLGEANARLEVSARSDPLLGIPNRRLFDERLAQEWLRARRENSRLALLMIDVDYFKRYNDTYGHQAGDRCLQRVARAIDGQMQRPGDFVARYGGEELVVLLPNTGVAGARWLGRQICQRVASLRIVHGASDIADQVTVSVGAACVVPSFDSTPADLIAQADRALYRAKSDGRNRVCGSDAAQPVPLAAPA